MNQLEVICELTPLKGVLKRVPFIGAKRAY